MSPSFGRSQDSIKLIFQIDFGSGSPGPRPRRPASGARLPPESGWASSDLLGMSLGHCFDHPMKTPNLAGPEEVASAVGEASRSNRVDTMKALGTTALGPSLTGGSQGAARRLRRGRRSVCPLGVVHAPTLNDPRS